MKKTILTLAFVSIAILSFGGIFDLGLKAGVNSTKFTLNQSSKDIAADAKAGYELGAFMRVGGKFLYFQPEFMYIVKNSSVQTTTGTSTSTTTTQYTSLQVPLLAGVRLLNLKVASIHLFTGPALSFAPNAKIADVKQNLNDKSAWSWKLGAGVDLLIFTFNIRYDWGLSDMTVANVQNTVFKNGKTFTASLGIKLF